MTTVDFIIALFCQVDAHLHDIPKHPEARLWPSEVVTLGLLHALKGVGNRAFYRWLTRDYRGLFPRLPERTRLFRLFQTHHDWTQAFLASPTVLGVIDTYGIELIHPTREGRSPQQIGRKGLSNHRWIVGGKLCLLRKQWGVIVGWACATATVADNTVEWLIRQWEERMMVLSDTGFMLPRAIPPISNMPAQRVGGPEAGRDGALDADAGRSWQTGHAPGLGFFAGAPGLHHGRLQRAGLVAWFPTHRVGLRAPLDCRV